MATLGSEIILLAGGKGTRLSSLVKDVPKPMALIAGEPFLARLLRHLKSQGLAHAILSVGHLKDKVREYFGEAFSGIKISYSEEDTPLGTGGAIRKAARLCDSPQVLALNGDTFLKMDLRQFSDFHLKSKSDLTVAAVPVENGSRYGTLVLNQSKVVSLLEKGFEGPAFINGGTYAFNIERLLKEDWPEVFSWEKDLLPRWINSTSVGAYKTYGEFLDLGVPEDFERAQTLIPQWLG